jgi:hypothetical protein
MPTKSELIKEREKKQSQYDKLAMDLAQLKALNKPTDKVADAMRELFEQIREIDKQLLIIKD